MRNFLIIVSLISFCFNVINASDGNCSINIQDLTINQPLFIKPGTNEFLFPNDYRKINLRPGDQIELFCEKTFKADKKEQKVLLTCGQDQIDKFLECNDRNNETARFMHKKCSYLHGGAERIEIGFEIFDNFFKLMEICYDTTEEKSIYTKSELGPYSSDFQMNVEREYFKEGNFHPNFEVGRLYSKYIQTKTLKYLLGDISASKFLNDNGIARGHLAPMADFIYAPHQLATFFYVNVAPQWHTFNSKNWVNLENTLRKFASKQKLNLDIYTGTYDILKLTSDNKADEELYLYVNGNEKKIPIPKFFYKIIVDKENKKGVVVIGVNNPYVSEDEIKKDYVICKDIQANLKWIRLNTNNLNYGYMYACTIQDFVSVVKHMRFIKSKGILYA